jgi:anti-sigma28 factor (negative regulator of flagellin synthesis)
MSHEIPKIPSSRPLSGVAGTGRKASPKGDTPQSAPATAIELPVDQVQVSELKAQRERELEDLRLSEEDLARLTAQVRSIPDEIDLEKVARVKADLAEGAYGKHALDGTVEGITQEWGL